MIFFSVRSNKVHGKLSFEALPRTLEIADIAFNKLCGSCALQDLPDTMLELRADGNKFSGELSFVNLPSNMVELEIPYNELTGSLHIESLPQTLTTLILTGNAFSDYVLPTGIGDYLPQRERNAHDNRCAIEDD